MRAKTNVLAVLVVVLGLCSVPHAEEESRWTLADAYEARMIVDAYDENGDKRIETRIKQVLLLKRMIEVMEQEVAVQKPNQERRREIRALGGEAKELRGEWDSLESEYSEIWSKIEELPTEHQPEQLVEIIAMGKTGKILEMTLQVFDLRDEIGKLGKVLKIEDPFEKGE